MLGKKDDFVAKRFGDVLQAIAKKKFNTSKGKDKLESFAQSAVFTGMVEIKPDLEIVSEVEEYTGILENELKSLLMGKRLTMSNLKKELSLSKKHEKQLSEIIEKITDTSIVLNNISFLHNKMKYSKDAIKKYSNSEKFFLWLFNNKTYKQNKEIINLTKSMLKNTYNINSQKDFKKHEKNIERKKVLLPRLKASLNKVIKKRNLLTLAIKKLSEKIKGNIASKHPELANYIDLLSCEQAQNLRTLKEKHGFIPRGDTDFKTAMKSCRYELKLSKINKASTIEKLALLESIYTAISGNHSLNRFKKRLDRKVDGSGKTLEPGSGTFH